MKAIDSFCPKCEPSQEPERDELRPNIVMSTKLKLQDAMKLYILTVFKQYGYNKARTARALRISLRTMRNKFEEWDFTANEIGQPSNPEMVEQVNHAIRKLKARR